MLLFRLLKEILVGLLRKSLIFSLVFRGGFLLFSTVFLLECREVLGERFVVFSLVFYISFYRIFINSHGRNIIATAPKHSFGEFLGLFLDPARCFALENTNDIGNGVLWGYGDMQMDMFITNVPCFNLPMFPSTD